MDILEQIQSVRRELQKRRNFYPKWVNKGKMTQQKADYEISCMEAVLFTLQVLQEGINWYTKDRDKPDQKELFNNKPAIEQKSKVYEES